MLPTGKDKDKTVDSEEYYQVTDHNGTYYLDAFEKGLESPKDAMSARILHVGSYKFVMLKYRKTDDSFAMIRYQIKDRTLKTYTLSKEATRAFLKKNYPDIKNIEISTCAVKTCMYDPGVSINNFDEKVYKVLTDIPDTEKFWTSSQQWQKMP